MRFMVPAVGVALAAVVLSVQALAGVTIELRSGNRVRGTFEPGGEAEVYLLDIPSEAALTVRLKRIKKGPAPTLVLRDAEGTDVAGDAVVEKPKAALLRRFPIPATGRYRLEVSARDGQTAGDYALSVQWKSPREYALEETVGEGDLEIPFAADGGARLNAKLKALKGSAVVPRVTRIEGPGEFVLSFDAAKRATAKLKKIELPVSGDYRLFVTDEAAAGGELTGKLKIKQPRSRAKVDLSAQLIEDGDGDTAAVGRIVTRRGAVLELATLAGEDEGFDDLLGTVLDIPADALPNATPVVIATSDDLVPKPPRDTVPTRAGPAVNFGPDGLRFERPVTVTLPIDAAAAGDPDSVVVFTQSGRRKPVLVDGVVVDADAQVVTFPVSHFSAYQAFRLLAEPEPFVLDATIEEYVVASPGDAPNSLSAYPAGGFDGGGPGLVYETGSVQQFFALDLPGRSGARAPIAIPVDALLGRIAYRPSDGRLFGALDNRVYTVIGGSRQLFAGTGIELSAGDGGPATSASFDRIAEIQPVADGLLVAEPNRIRKVAETGPDAGDIDALYGMAGGDTSDGVDPALAGFQLISDVVPTGAANDELFVAEFARIRRIGGTAGVNQTIAGDGVLQTDAAEGRRLLEARFDGIIGIAYDAARSVIYVADSFTNPVVYALDLDADVVRRLAGNPRSSGTITAGARAPGTLDFIGDLVVVDGVPVWSERTNDRILFLDFAGDNPF